MTAKKNITDTEFNTLMIQVADKLKELRINAGYTSYENFAWDNNINRMQYWKMEKGETNFTMKSLHKILQAHKMSVTEFFSEGFSE
ncbi:helix-turn-helix transcriptional regulator [uncultured Dokdonia sp.]|uniref:helix-turn-helix domain-containing protein n=1 Tax=uncultured Dokdonia sp. TaxID=575653 RepID=UPI00260E05DD|nr:helix-turn-helix transcriptional regulator [uncultured Dokdonia sp.]